MLPDISDYAGMVVSTPTTDKQVPSGTDNDNDLQLLDVNGAAGILLLVLVPMVALIMWVIIGLFIILIPLVIGLYYIYREPTPTQETDNIESDDDRIQRRLSD